MADDTAHASTTTQVHRVYIRATAQEIWDVITSPESTARFGYGGHAHYELRPGGALGARPIVHGSSARNRDPLPGALSTAIDPPS